MIAEHNGIMSGTKPVDGPYLFLREILMRTDKNGNSALIRQSRQLVKHSMAKNCVGRR